MKGKNTHEVSNNFFNQVKENGMHDCHEDTTDKAQKRGRVSINNRSHSWCFLTFKYCSYAVSCYTVKVSKWEKKEKVSTFLTKVGSSNYAQENAQLIDYAPFHACEAHLGLNTQQFLSGPMFGWSMWWIPN